MINQNNSYPKCVNHDNLYDSLKMSTNVTVIKNAILKLIKPTQEREQGGGVEDTSPLVFFALALSFLMDPQAIHRLRPHSL